MAKAYALTGLQLHEVSLVDRGAVRRRFALTKRHGGKKTMPNAKTRKDDPGAPPAGPATDDGENEVLEQLLDTPMSNEADISQAFSGMSDDARNAAIGAMRILSGFADQFGPQDWQTMLSIASGGQSDDGSQDDASQGGAADTAGKDQSGDDSDGGGDDSESESQSSESEDSDKSKEPPMPDKTDTQKAEYAALQKAHKDEMTRIEKAAKERAEKAEARTAAIEKQLAEAQDAAQTKACIEKAQSEFAHCGDSREIGALLKSAQGDDLKRLETLLRATEERLKKSALFSTAGHSHPAPERDDTAGGQLQQKANEIAKADPKLSPPQAYAQALAQNPELYNQFREEHRRAR